MDDKKNKENKENKKTKAEEKSGSGRKPLIIGLVIFIAAAVIAAAALLVPDFVKAQQKKAAYLKTAQDLVQSYIDRDTDKFISLCYPGGFYKVELDGSYSGDDAELRDAIDSHVVAESKAMGSTYGGYLEGSVKLDSVETADSENYVYFKNQAETVAESGKAEITVTNVDKVTFTLDIKGSGAGQTINNCTMYICETEEYGAILWEWDFNGVSWDVQAG